MLQSGTCQAGVNSCQVGLWSAPLPRARAAEGGPYTYLRQQITSAETIMFLKQRILFCDLLLSHFFEGSYNIL